MSALTTGEVMEALRWVRESVESQLRHSREVESKFPSARELEARYRRTVLEPHLRSLALLEKYAPEMVQREAEEYGLNRSASGVLSSCADAAVDKLDAALKSLDPPEMLERADREDEG